MLDENYTRCPGCKTVFRVRAEQLALRDGQVRCGQCRTVFDANLHSVSLAPVASENLAGHDALADGPPTVTLRSGDALIVPPETAGIPEPAFAPDEVPVETTAAATAEIAGEASPTAADLRSVAADAGSDAIEKDAEAGPIDEPADRAWARWRNPAYASVVALLAVVLIGQALYHYRDVIAARWPGTKPALASLCGALGCQIRPLRDISGLGIDASDLQADPAHRGLLILTATIRNRAAVPLDYPYLEVALTDVKDQVVVQKALGPGDYAGGAANIGAGIPANGEVIVKLFVDASATNQAGYRLYLFYP